MVAFNEPGLMDREVWFYLSHHPGYEREKDGFGYLGAPLLTLTLPQPCDSIV